MIHITKPPRARNQHTRKMTRLTIRSVRSEVSELEGKVSELELSVKRLEDAIKKLQAQRSESEEFASEEAESQGLESNESGPKNATVPRLLSEQYLKVEFEHAKKHMLHLAGEPSTLLKRVKWKRIRKLEGIEWSTRYGFENESHHYYKRRFDRLFDHPILLYLSDKNGVRWVYLVEDVTIQGVLAVIERHWSALIYAGGGKCEELDEEATKQLGQEVMVETSDNLYLDYIECIGRGKWAPVLST